ncbi:MAG: type II secretion system F family protein [Planctomycetaceae bacterium]
MQLDEILNALVALALAVMPLVAGIALVVIVRLVRRGRGRRSEAQTRNVLHIFGLGACGMAALVLLLVFFAAASGAILDVGGGLAVLFAFVACGLIAYGGSTAISAGRKFSRRPASSAAAFRSTASLWIDIDGDLGRMRAVGWMLIFLPLFYLTLAGGVLLAVFAAGVLVVLRAHRRGREAMLLGLLADAVENQTPLADEIEAFADTHEGRFARKLRDVAAQLQSGAPLSEALARQPGLVPRSSLLAIRIGEDTGTLAPRLRDEANRRGPAAEGQYYPVSPTIFVLYALSLPIVLFVVVSFVSVWIIPEFAKIFSGFDQPLPAATRWLITVSAWFRDFFYLIALPGVLAPLAMGFALFAWYRGWGEFDIPLVGRWFRRWDTPDLLRNLAATIEANRPLSDTLELLEVHHRRTAVRRAVRRVRAAHEQGGNLWEALRRERLLRRGEPGLIESAERTGNVPWVLRQLATTIENRRNHRLAMLGELVVPVLVVGMGVLVGLVAVGMLMPVIELTAALATSIR